MFGSMSIHLRERVDESTNELSSLMLMPKPKSASNGVRIMKTAHTEKVLVPFLLFVQVGSSTFDAQWLHQ